MRESGLCNLLAIAGPCAVKIIRTRVTKTSSFQTQAKVRVRNGFPAASSLFFCCHARSRSLHRFTKGSKALGFDAKAPGEAGCRHLDLCGWMWRMPKNSWPLRFEDHGSAVVVWDDFAWTASTCNSNSATATVQRPSLTSPGGPQEKGHQLKSSISRPPPWGSRSAEGSPRLEQRTIVEERVLGELEASLCALSVTLPPVSPT